MSITQGLLLCCTMCTVYYNVYFPVPMGLFLCCGPCCTSPSKLSVKKSQITGHGTEWGMWSTCAGKAKQEARSTPCQKNQPTVKGNTKL